MPSALRRTFDARQRTQSSTVCKQPFFFRENKRENRRALLGIEPRPLAIFPSQSKYRTSRLQGRVINGFANSIDHGGHFTSGDVDIFRWGGGGELVTYVED